MPLYEYRCRKCGALIERIQRFAAAPLKTCKSCGGQLERLISSSSFQLKGSGWYVSDYSRKSSAPAPSASSDGKSSASTASETKKTAEPAPPKPSKESKS